MRRRCCRRRCCCCCWRRASSDDDTAEDAPRARVCDSVFASETPSIGARHARHVSGSRQPECAPNCLTTAGVAVVVADCDVNRDDYDAARSTRSPLKIENGRILENVISSQYRYSIRVSVIFFLRSNFLRLLWSGMRVLLGVGGGDDPLCGASCHASVSPKRRRSPSSIIKPSSSSSSSSWR